MKYSLFILIFLASNAGNAKTWLVGPTRQYTAPGKVESLVADGDTVLVDSGTYVGDVATWNANNLVLRCPNGMARFNANGNIAGLKGIWLFYGKNAYVEGFEFYGAQISAADGDNGAGIRVQGNNFTCRRCYFHDNQEGILTGNDTNNNNIWIEACEFDHNGVETGGAAGYEHNIYVGHSTSCTIEFCYFHRSIVGHEIKTRASRNYILYNYIVDDTSGDGSYSIDVPNGGVTCIVGNAIEKGPKTANSTVVTFGEEGIINGDSLFYFISNTVVTDRNPTTFLNVQGTSNGEASLIANNIFAGPGHPLSVNYAYFYSNVVSSDTSFFHFRDPIHFDYHPTANFQGLYSEEGFGSTGNERVVLNAESEYVHPLDSAVRNWDYEVGAFKAIYPDTLSDSIIIVQNLPSRTCVGDTSFGSIAVRNTGNAAVAYDFTNEPDFEFFADKLIQPDSIDTIIVRFTPSTNDVERDTLSFYGSKGNTVILQDSGGAAIISGNGSAPVTPVGTTSTFSVKICNTGTCEWTPGTPIVQSPFTYVSGGLTPINPGGCEELVFTFSPTSDGFFSSTVQFPNASGISIPAPTIAISAQTNADDVTEHPKTIVGHNFPNPFLFETLFPNISGSLKLFNECGNEMHVITEQTENGILLERGNLPPGIYFYRIAQAGRGAAYEGSAVVTN